MNVSVRRLGPQLNKNTADGKHDFVVFFYSAASFMYLRMMARNL